MNRSLVTVPFVAMVAASLGAPALLAADTRHPPPQVLEYKIQHALYGEIGTYSNVIETAGDTVDVRSSLRIAVRFLGLAMYREEAERRERWIGDRLMAFRSVTEKNGERIEVTGEARGDAFVIQAPWGTAEAPADVRPSNPWSGRMLRPSTMMSTTTGKLFRTRVSGGKEELVTMNGQPRKLRQYEIFSDKREFVWIDDQGLPVAFGTEDDGARVEFILTRVSSPSGDHPSQFRPDKLPRTSLPLVEAMAD